MNKLIKGSIALMLFAITIGIFEMCTKENVIAQAASYVLPIATTTTLGGVKPDGTTILVDGTGKISAAGTAIPVATTTTLGGVKPDGTTIIVDGTGKISSVGSQQQNKIIFAEITPGTPSALSEIWIANYDGSGATKVPVPSLPSGFMFQGIRMSPDGQTIFIAGYDPSNNVSQVYSMTSTGANPKKIINYDGWSASSSILQEMQAY